MIGELLGAGLSYLGAREANSMTKKLAREQMQFQERMSNTSYQRAMADMEKAGLNPILAANLGGASSPGGSTAQMQNELSGAVSSAMDIRRARAELKNLEAQNANLHKQNVKIDAESDLARAQAELTRNSAKSVAWDPLIKQQQFTQSPWKFLEDILGPYLKIFMNRKGK